MEICLWTALLRSHHRNSIRLRSGVWLGHCNILILFFFSHSVINLMVFLGTLSCCMTQSLPTVSCQTDILWYTEEFIVDWKTARSPGPVAAKLAQIITPPPHCLTVGMRYVCGVWLLALCIMAKNLHFVSSVQKGIVPEAILIQYFSNCTVMNCNMLTEACRAWGVALDFLLTFTVWPWGEFVETSTSGKIGNWQMFD